MEKENYNVDESPSYNGRAGHVIPATGEENKSDPMMEAGEVYGNSDTAEEFGYVHRGYVAHVRDQTFESKHL